VSNYTKLTDFAAKDALSVGDPDKLVLGAELDAEFEALEAAVASKSDATGTGNVELVDATPLVDTAANTVAETAVITTTVPANSLAVDSWIKYRAYLCLHNAEGNTRTFRVKVYVGNSGTDLVYDAVFSVATGTEYDLYLDLMQYGVTASSVLTQIDGLAIPALALGGTAAAPLAAGSPDHYTADTVTLASAQTFKVTVTPSTANAALAAYGVDGFLYTMPSAP
jgi:hypothetical protein